MDAGGKSVGVAPYYRSFAAEQRGMWQAKPETKQALQELFLSMEGELEERGE